MNKINQKILLFFLFSFSVYCALIIGETWDERAHLTQGKITLDYLFSLGKIDKDLFYREFYSPIYWSLLYLLTNVIPNIYQVEATHFVNLVFSIGGIFGIARICKILFDKNVGNLAFLILFFYPIYFGHMAFNSKDTILSFCHVWLTYLILTYLKKQNSKYEISKYIWLLGVLAAMGSGIQLVFLGSLIPIFIFVSLDIFLFKKLINKNFDRRKFLLDLIKCFFIFYFMMTLFWIDTHPNIFLLPYNFIIEFLSSDFWTGWPYNLVNGDYYLSREIPKSYFLINFLYKSPEYLLIAYVFFIFLFLLSGNTPYKKYIFFNYKLILIISILIFPTVTLYLVPYPIYDGMRLFLWAVPYFCIIPALIINYQIKNINNIKSKLGLIFLLILFLYHLINFFSVTPYQYTYLNILNGKIETRYKKFENDYWGSSIKELIKYTNFDKSKTIKLATCGINHEIAKNYLEKKGNFDLQFIPPADADYIIMTNRVSEKKNGKKKLINCFDKFKGENISQVKRNGMILSVVRKLNYNSLQ